TNERIREMPHWIALIVEFAVGLGLILLFKRVWENAHHTLDEIVDPERPRNLLRTAWLVAVYLWRVALVPFAVVGVAAAILASAALVWSAYLWMAPAALLLSVLAKSYLEHDARPFERWTPGWYLACVPHVCGRRWADARALPRSLIWSVDHGG